MTHEEDNSITHRIFRRQLTYERKYYEKTDDRKSMRNLAGILTKAINTACEG